MKNLNHLFKPIDITAGAAWATILSQAVSAALCMGRLLHMPALSFGTAATFLVRLLLAYLMTELTKSAQTPLGRPESLYFSQLLAWVFGILMTIALYRRGKCRYLRQTA